MRWRPERDFILRTWGLREASFRPLTWDVLLCRGVWDFEDFRTSHMKVLRDKWEVPQVLEVLKSQTGSCFSSKKSFKQDLGTSRTLRTSGFSVLSFSSKKSLKKDFRTSRTWRTSQDFQVNGLHLFFLFKKSYELNSVQVLVLDAVLPYKKNRNSISLTVAESSDLSHNQRWTPFWNEIVCADTRSGITQLQR